MTKTYWTAAAVCCLTLPVAIAGLAHAVPAYAAALAIVGFALSLAVVVAELTRTVPYASVGWASDSVPVQVAPEPIAVVKRRPRAVKVAPIVVAVPVVKAKRTSRVAAKSTTPSKVAPKVKTTRKAPAPS